MTQTPAISLTIIGFCNTIRDGVLSAGVTVRLFCVYDRTRLDEFIAEQVQAVIDENLKAGVKLTGYVVAYLDLKDGSSGSYPEVWF